MRRVRRATRSRSIRLSLPERGGVGTEVGANGHISRRFATELGTRRDRCARRSHWVGNQVGRLYDPDTAEKIDVRVSTPIVTRAEDQA